MTNTVRQALERDAEVDAVGFFRRVALAIARVRAGWRAPRRANDQTTAAVGTDSTTAAIRRGVAKRANNIGAVCHDPEKAKEERDDAETT